MRSNVSTLLAAFLICALGLACRGQAGELAAEEPTAEPSQVELSSLQDPLDPTAAEDTAPDGEEHGGAVGLEESRARIQLLEERLRDLEAELARTRSSTPPRPTRPAVPDEAPVESVDTEPLLEEPEPPPEPIPVTLPAGTVLAVELLQDLSSATSQVGESFIARLVDDVEGNGLVAIPAGSQVLGAVTAARRLKKIGGTARLELIFTEVELSSGELQPIRAFFGAHGNNETKRDAATIGGATVGGAVLGRILKNKNKTEGTLVGSVVGAAVGTAVAAKTAGQEVDLPSGTILTVQLEETVELLVEDST